MSEWLNPLQNDESESEPVVAAEQISVSGRDNTYQDESSESDDDLMQNNIQHFI